MTHRINNNEMDPRSECGLEIEVMVERHDTFALMEMDPTCPECLAKERAGRSESCPQCGRVGRLIGGWSCERCMST